MFQEKVYVSDDFGAAVGVSSGRGADIHLVGCAEQREYEAGHLLGAVNLPYERLDEVEAEIPKDRPVVIYCAYGGQSLLAARKLAGCGYDAVNALGGLHYYRGKYYVRCKE